MSQHCHDIKQGDVKRLVILVHGFQSTSVDSWVSEMKNKILNHKHWATIGVLTVDWSKGAAGLLSYRKVAANTRYVASPPSSSSASGRNLIKWRLIASATLPAHMSVASWAKP